MFIKVNSMYLSFNEIMLCISFREENIYEEGLGQPPRIEGGGVRADQEPLHSFRQCDQDPDSK